MLTIDASVWVNADDPSETGSAASRALLDRVAARGETVSAPTLLLVEVAAAISRSKGDPELARAYAEHLGSLPFLHWVSLDRSLAQLAAHLAAAHSLRGADAVYAAVALSTGAELISLDHEHLSRLAAVLRVRTPADALGA